PAWSTTPAPHILAAPQDRSETSSDSVSKRSTHCQPASSSPSTTTPESPDEPPSGKTSSEPKAPRCWPDTPTAHGPPRPRCPPPPPPTPPPHTSAPPCPNRWPATFSTRPANAQASTPTPHPTWSRSSSDPTTNLAT